MNILPTKNLAPIKPLEEMSEMNTPQGTYITSAVIELLNDFLKKDKDVFREMANTTLVTSNFIQGKQIWQPNYWNNEWTIRPVHLADPNKISSINIMQFYCTSQIKMFTQSNPDLEPIEEFKQRKYKEAVKRAKAVWNRYEGKFYTNWFNQQEALHAIISGNYIESVEYDQLQETSTVFKEIFGESEIEISPGYSRCFECGSEGAAAGFMETPIPSCPQCGSYEILPPEPPVKQSFSTVIGVQPLIVGDLTLKLLPIQSTRFDITKRPAESSWFLRREYVSRRKLEYLLGINIPTRSMDADDGLRALREISRAGNTLAGKKSFQVVDETDDTVLLDRLSVCAEHIHHIIPATDEKMVDGGKFKKGQRLSELAPNGGTFLIANEKYLIGFFPDVHHSKELSSGVYHMRLESGVGRGSEDTVEVQKRFIRFDSQNVRYMEAAATPAKTYIKGSVDRNHVKQIGNPGAVIPINQEIAQAMGSRPVIEQLQPGTMAAQFFSYTYDILNQYRQLTSHATDATGAFPGVDNRTATGARLAKSNAESVFSPMLQIKSEARLGTAHNTIGLYREHFQGVSQYYSFGETTTGQSIGDNVRGEDIDPTIRFTVVRNSEQPKTMYDRQTDFANMMQVASAGGGIQMIKQSDPKLYEALIKSFDIDLDDNVYSVTSDVCEARLEEAINLQEQYVQIQQMSMENGMEIPEIPLEGILFGLSKPIILEEPNHMLKAKWFMDFLDAPHGFALEENKRSIVQLFVRTHFQFEMQQQAALASGFTQVQMAGAAPQMEAQAAAEEEGRANEEEKNEARKQEERENRQYEIDEENLRAEEDFQRQKELINQQHENSMAQASTKQ